MKIARLIVTYKCPNDCAGCCNKDWKYDPPKPITHFDYDQILITGGEPLLFAERVMGLASAIRCMSKAKIYVYTATVLPFLWVMPFVDGMTLTLHTESDVERYAEFAHDCQHELIAYPGSLRLNVFNECKPDPDRQIYLPCFQTKFVDWVKDCPLPPGEELLRLPVLW